MSLSQIGEFFIIATLGITLKVTSDFVSIVVVSAITTYDSFMVKLSTPFSKYLERNLPKKWTKRIERYSANNNKSDQKVIGKLFYELICCRL
jgi:CPA2 family monovalent cation:H+ antiporter-2